MRQLSVCCLCGLFVTDLFLSVLQQAENMNVSNADIGGGVGWSYLADGPHVPQVLTVLREMKVSVHLQDKLQVQVLPVCGVMDEVGIDPLPRLII